jgi:hypothetical protein
MEISQAGKLIIVVGIALVVIGGLILLLGRVPFFGQLPGDINYRRNGTTIFIPITTMIILSLLLTLILNLLLRR